MDIIQITKIYQLQDNCKFLQEQLEYEEKEKKRLIKAKTIDGKLKGINHKFIPEKERKVLRLKQRIQKVENSQQGLQQ